MSKVFYEIGAVPGTAQKAYNMLGETMTIESAIQELIHGAYEHGHAKMFTFNYTEDSERGTSKIVIFNNGAPMLEPIFKKFTEKYQTHEVSELQSYQHANISTTGQGTHDACVILSNPASVSKIYIRNYYEDGRVGTWTWIVDRKNADNGKYAKGIQWGEHGGTHGSGFEITIETSCLIGERQFEEIQKNISKTYSDVFIENGPTIYMSRNEDRGKKLQLQDMMYLSELKKVLPDLTNEYDCEPGTYSNGTMIWNIIDKTYRIKDAAGVLDDTMPIEFTQRYIMLYINSDAAGISDVLNRYDMKLKSINSGIYPLLDCVYLETGGNTRQHFCIPNNGGGSARVRLCPLIKNESKKIWGVQSNKTKGIRRIIDNEYMNMYYNLDVPSESMSESIINLYRLYEREYHNRLRDNFGKYKEGRPVKVLVEKFNQQEVADFTKLYIEGKIDKLEVIKENVYGNNLIGEIDSPEVARRMLYTLNTKEGLILRQPCESDENDDSNEEKWTYKLNKPIPIDVNQSDIIFSFFEALAPILKAEDYQYLNTNLKLKHYE